MSPSVLRKESPHLKTVLNKNVPEIKMEQTSHAPHLPPQRSGTPSSNESSSSTPNKVTLVGESLMSTPRDLLSRMSRDLFHLSRVT